MLKQMWKCGMHLDEFYKQEIKGGSVKEFSVQIVMQDRCEDCNACPHDGEDCDGHNYCEICGDGPLTEGVCFEEDANYRCKRVSCEPRDIWIAGEFCKTPEEAYEASERHGGNVCYYTEWEESEFCDCRPECKCRQTALDKYPIYFDAKLIHQVDVIGRGKYGALAVINSQQGEITYADSILEWSDKYMENGIPLSIDPGQGRVEMMPTDEEDE